MLNVGYKSASDDIVFEEFEGELVVLNLSSGQYFGFNQSAAIVWGALMAGVHPVNITSSALPGDVVPELVQKLISFELIKPDQTANTDLDATTMAELERSTTKPSVEMFEDLADLIVADPIHDVDTQEGWPVKSELN